ncbi:MAG: hypothetical protein KJ950_02015 [Proteobacteria bacterium]|nr:hypothetical protein [Pseudomonadota bacterium]MBU1688275.1 hypothetical protein [Pseudomonadota bacterium]
MSKKIPWPLLIISLISFILLANNQAKAESFPFRSVNEGDQLPAITLTGAQSAESLKLSQGDQRYQLLIFWSADVATKRERSLETLKVVAQMDDFFKEKKISYLVVNEGEDSPEITTEIMKNAGLSATPVYLDADRNIYGTLGIFVMPSMLLINREGKITGGMGYSRDLAKRLRGELQIMLGEINRTQLEEALHPKNIEKTEEEKNAHRHFLLGQTMRQRGQPESAIKEFQKALEFDQTMAEAHIQIGCLYLETDQLEASAQALEEGLSQNPDSVDGQVCQARIKSLGGAGEEAVQDLRFLLMRNARHADLHYMLATILLEQGNCGEAAPEFRTAYDLLLKKERTNGP